MSINGPGDSSSKVGIAIPNSTNVGIQGSGSIRDFQAGILITGSDNTRVNQITFEGNKMAVFITNSSGTTVEQNFIGPNTIGIASHSSIRPQIHANMMSGKYLAGVTLVNTDKGLVDANSIGGSRNGIFLDAQSTKNTVMYNDVLKNDVDINNADGLPLNINGNELLKNNCFVSQPSGYCFAQ
ncbi:MAG: right-handed parallel beta-helix repeat-containing protein [Nitrososphaeraceae archaeon]